MDTNRWNQRGRGGLPTRGRGGSKPARGRGQQRRSIPADISSGDVDVSWRGGTSMDRAFEDVDGLLGLELTTWSLSAVEPVPVMRWIVPRQEFDKDKFAYKHENHRKMKFPVWKYPTAHNISSIKQLADGDQYPSATDTAVLSAESALWDAFDVVIGQENRKQEIVIGVSSDDKYADAVIAGRLRVFGATSTFPDKKIVRMRPYERAAVRGVCNDILSDGPVVPKLLLYIGDSPEAVRVVLCSAIVLKAVGFIVRVHSMDTLTASAVHTACMYFDVGVVRYSDGSTWIHGKWSGGKSPPVSFKTFMQDPRSIPDGRGPTRNSTFLSEDEFTSPRFAATAGALIDSIDGVGGAVDSCAGWAARTRWEYFR